MRHFTSPRRAFPRFVVGFAFSESPDRGKLFMPWTVGKGGSREDVGFPVAAQRLVIPVGWVDFSVAEHRRQSQSQLPGKDTKDGLAFRTLPEMRLFPMQKWKILAERLRLGLLEQTERFDVDWVRHGAHLSTRMDGPIYL